MLEEDCDDGNEEKEETDDPPVLDDELVSLQQMEGICSKAVGSVRSQLFPVNRQTPTEHESKSSYVPLTQVSVQIPTCKHENAEDEESELGGRDHVVEEFAEADDAGVGGPH